MSGFRCKKMPEKIEMIYFCILRINVAFHFKILFKSSIFIIISNVILSQKHDGLNMKWKIG